jgi:hypothetical protein
MNYNKLSKRVEKHYFSHGQQLIVDTWEQIENNDRDCAFEVYIADVDIHLFMIQNYNGFKGREGINKSYFRPEKYKFIETWDGVRASCMPLYFDNTITLKTFKQITKEDIIHATDYFVHEVLHLWLFNIKFNEKKNK